MVAQAAAWIVVRWITFGDIAIVGLMFSAHIFRPWLFSGCTVGLAVLFLIAVLGCGSGFMSVLPGMHGGMECTGMFSGAFVVSHKELGMQSVALLVAVSLGIIFWGTSLVSVLVFQQQLVQVVLRIRSCVAYLSDHILQHFAAGILHPKLY